MSKKSRRPVRDRTDHGRITGVLRRFWSGRWQDLQYSMGPGKTGPHGWWIVLDGQSVMLAADVDGAIFALGRLQGWVMASTMAKAKVEPLKEGGEDDGPRDGDGVMAPDRDAAVDGDDPAGGGDGPDDARAVRGRSGDGEG